jgi:PleD family two-component response regulator
MKSASSGELVSHRSVGHDLIGDAVFPSIPAEIGQASPGAIMKEQRVLLVEDDASLARSMVEGLSDEGLAVVHAADGDAALVALRAGEWDLVILD